MATEQTFRRALTEWLALTRDVDLPTGLEREAALARACLLRRRILTGSITPEELEIDEEAKDVLYALVEILKSNPAPNPDRFCQESNEIYQFIRIVNWPDDAMQERKDLILACAELGWSSIGHSLAEVIRGRIVAYSPDTDLNAGRPANFDLRRVPNPQISQALLKLIGLKNKNDSLVATEASAHYMLVAKEKTYGLFDGRDYLLGEFALLAAGGHRGLGNYVETESWLQRAELAFRQTLAPEPFLARCLYVRASLGYDTHRHKLVLALIPRLLSAFEEFGMRAELFKTRFLEAMTLKASSRRHEAFDRLHAMRYSLREPEDTGLLGQVHVELGAYYSWQGKYTEAFQSFREGQVLLSRAGWVSALACLKLEVGETLQLQGRFASAVEAYRGGIAAYSEAGIATYESYGRLLLAGALMELGRHREAEREILAAMPTLEKHEMVAKAVAAVALLRESVRARKTDPDALRELREHLKGRT